MSSLTATAIVLQRREYGDFDLIITLLADAYGKRTLIAKAAKKSAKRFPGILEPFNQLNITFREPKRKGMPVLEEATLKQPVENLRSDFLKTAYASYWVEIINTWMEEGQVRKDIYQLLASSLNALNLEEMNAAILNIIFQMRFIGHEGLRPVLEHCSSCRMDIEALPQNHFCVDLSKGGIVCNQCPEGVRNQLRLSKGTLKQLQWIAGGDLAKAMKMRFSPGSLAEANAFLEAFIPYYIGKKPKSLRYLQKIRYP